MNVVRSAGGGGGDSGNSYKFENENPASINPVRKPTCSMADLLRKTSFTKDEIRHLYRSFKQDCPSGEVSKAHFSSIFSTLFPGGECFRYATFLFRNIDRSNSGFIRFEDLIATLSILIHGSVEARLGWIFDLYDLNKDGMLTRTELSQIVASIFQLMVPVGKVNFASVASAIEERTDKLFQSWDKNGNGLVYKEDFLQYCLQDDTIQRSIAMLKTDISL
ncbi:unnamed protein product [Rotaria socialis]|uniref:EF-hand domain-containing protein n=4 Tax=Rotaria socialis TaxID=392032 RepID=A0A819WX82_9BILA|nr:unnamed protein product [Rotaria socialis]CAF3350709.1 unnamed protein product [Rotaria socialis]CAF3365185.1 unnamed protein product [Rotaria socialis]CAF3535769.1 unnamed protein product [Rotaria socialis]CAF3608431.1 unnamed protein product [Rotaria socialis]